MEEAMSFLTSSSKHFSLNEDSAKALFLDTTSYLFSLQMDNVDNKVVVAFLRKNLLEKYQVNIPQQKMYEILSQIMGLKNYNVALSKQVEFKSIFMKELSQVLEGVFTGGYTSPYLKNTIPTGLKELDNDLGGGLKRGWITTVLSKVNTGKSMFCVSVGANALRSHPDLKVLHVCLEGDGKNSTLGYTTNLNEETYRETLLNLKTAVGNKNLNNYKKRLMVINGTSFNYKMESLIEKLNDIHKSFSFDLLVIDYPQLLEMEGELEYRLKLAKMYRQLNNLAIDLNCAILAPAQVMRNLLINENEILKSTDIAGSFDIARMSSVILTLNKQKNNNQTLDVYLDKNRDVIKHKLYKTNPNYSGINLIL